MKTNWVKEKYTVMLIYCYRTYPKTQSLFFEFHLLSKQSSFWSWQ